MLKRKVFFMKSIILLSGGLDSLACLAITRQKYNCELAITFDYGQKALDKEIEASKKICDFYNVEHKIIKLDFLKEITQTALVSDKEVPQDYDMKAVWVPNRNGLFLNIAGSFADSYGYNYIIIGANKEEGKTFPDNTLEFAKRVEAEFEFSTLIQPKILIPLIDMDKEEIVKTVIDLKAPLELVHSCYLGGDKNCGKCESCLHLIEALKKNDAKDFIKKLF